MGFPSGESMFTHGFVHSGRLALRRALHFESQQKQNFLLLPPPLTKWDSPQAERLPPAPSIRAGSRYAERFTSNPNGSKTFCFLLLRLRSNRRRWDSNPRNVFTFTRFPSVLHRPLGHSSRKIEKSLTQALF